MSPDGSIGPGGPGGPGAPQPNTMPSGADTAIYSPNPQQQRLTLIISCQVNCTSNYNKLTCSCVGVI